MASNNNKSKKQSGVLVYLLGLTGLACLLFAAGGLVYTLSGRDPVSVPVAPPVIAGDSGAIEAPLDMPQTPPRTVTVEEVLHGSDLALAKQEPAQLARDDFYPLEVGRYWVYQRRNLSDGTVTEVERRIVRRESRPERELFFFGDGTVAYREDGKIFEMGPEGGVNVVPVAVSASAAPYVYRSQGLYIEQRIGARDTVLLAEGQRYEGCMQIITRFRREESGPFQSYASYYSPGIGLVGREMWPSRAGQPTEVLRDYGPHKM